MKAIVAGLGTISRLLLNIGMIALAIMMAITAIDVVLRASLNMPVRGVVDAVEVTMLLVVFLGLPEAFLRSEQVTVDVIDHLVPPRAVPVLIAIGAMLSTLFLFLIAINLVHPLLDAYRFGDRKADLPIPLYPLVAIVIVCVVTSTLAMILVTIRDWMAVLSGAPAPKSGAHP